jgi:hypothetical protein
LKQLTVLLLSGVWILTACGQALANDLSTPRIPATETTTFQSFTSTPLPTKTPRQRVYESTSTPRPPTPLPTIPTFTPTFDTSTIVTVPPASPTSCPTENPAITAEFATPNSDGSYEHYRPSDILGYLNSGGTLAQLRDSGIAEIIDLTNDGVNEVVYKGLLRVSVSILGCKDGKYQDYLDFGGDFGVNLIKAPDLNKNGMPELILYDISHYGFADIFIYEWDSNKFRSLINLGTDTSTGLVIDGVSATSLHKITDTNGDGLREIVIVYDVHETESWPFGIGMYVASQRPLRNQTIITLGWNGEHFVDLTPGNDELPQYRFQAIQDGDEQVRYGNYTTVLSLYQEAIFNDQLEWWSPERKEYEMNLYRSQFEATPTAYPTPKPDNTEYPHLAAYAYYRIMLLHIVQGHESDAGTVYKTLQQKFSRAPHGQPYVEMANAFWDTYQSTHTVYEACVASIQYAAAHREILIPLGSEYHGGYSHLYVPADVCLFR